MFIKVRKEPAMVIGTPVYILSNTVTLKRASLYAPAIGKTRQSRYPKIPKPLKLSTHVITEGATPKEIKSDSESNSFPSSLDAFSFLAILPSNLSISAATIISKDAITSEFPALLLLTVNIKAVKPKDIFVKVKMLGKDDFTFFNLSPQ